MYFILRSRKICLIFAAFLILGYLPTGTAFAQASASADAPKITKPEYKLPAGLLEMEGFKYPVYLYSHDGLEASKKYPLIFMIPSETDSP